MYRTINEPFALFSRGALLRTINSNCNVCKSFIGLETLIETNNQQFSSCCLWKMRMVIYTITINKDCRLMSITILLNAADEFILHVDDFLVLGTKNKPTAKKDSKINVTKVLLADVDFLMVIPFTYSFH
jgi:hypothetical protein